jgi:L-ascorbate metabolism protein UlaG (beta-lactamase superfamily)
MKITLIGHSSFLLEDSQKRKLLTDPYDKTVGYKVFQGDVDVVTISHHHFDHDYTKMINESAAIIDKVGLFYEKDISIKGIPSYHDKFKGAKRGENVIYIIEMDNLKICHLGDLGYILSQDEINELGDIDVLLIPVGGNFTIDSKEAAELCNRIKPHIVIPMHYKTPAITFPIDGVEGFINHMKNGVKINDSTLVIDKIPDERNLVKVLDYSK